MKFRDTVLRELRAPCLRQEALTPVIEGVVRNSISDVCLPVFRDELLNQAVDAALSYRPTKRRAKV